MPGSILTPQQRADYERDGYIMVRKLFDDEEIAIAQLVCVFQRVRRRAQRMHQLPDRR